EGGRNLPRGEVGEIAIRTAANMQCYWQAPEATAALFTPDGYVHTGDVGYLDEDGYLFIVDRKKDIIIRGGENISAAEVEAACYACAAVAEVSVFAAPDERLGEVPVAVIHTRDALTGEDLRAFLEQRIAKYKVPDRFIFSDQPLPRLGTGKIDRRALKAQYASCRSTAAHCWSAGAQAWAWSSRSPCGRAISAATSMCGAGSRRSAISS